jgi:hypothetical protein
MKKITIILALAIGGISQAQCYKVRNSESSVTATFSGGLAQTMNFELALRINSVHVGAGVGIMVDNQIKTKDNINYTRNDNAYFVNLGYQMDKVFLGARIGQQTIVHVTGTVNGVRQSIPDEPKLMVGGVIGYSVSPRIRFNIGYDTFNKANLGVAFGL